MMRSRVVDWLAFPFFTLCFAVVVGSMVSHFMGFALRGLWCGLILALTAGNDGERTVRSRLGNALNFLSRYEKQLRHG